MYKSFHDWCREQFGCKVYKLSLGGGFTCPNRDGTVGTGGCIFCSGMGSGEFAERGVDIASQLEKAKARVAQKNRGGKYMAYFQAFTNTYAPVAHLRGLYTEAMAGEDIVGLAIGTRPDCISEEVAELIAEYAKRVDVLVELGLQTPSDKTAELINRGYKRDAFAKALEILKKHSIPVCVHLIVGLPGEGDQELYETMEYLSHFDISGYKIHSIYVSRGTRLAEMYEAGEYSPPTDHCDPPLPFPRGDPRS
jgi:radical SAM protein (TIGR01212 family)